MHNGPLVSVIIPNYCHSKYLDERIKSVLNQTYQNFELIILDDCSPDNGASKSVIEKYRDDSHVSHIIYNEVNGGSPFRQWKNGISYVKGDIVWIAESDDSCSPFLLERLVDFYISEDLVMAFSLSMKIDSHGKEKGVVQGYIHENRIYQGADYISNDLALITNASSSIFSSKCARKICNGYECYKGAGDWLFWTGVAENGKVGILSEALNYYRVHDNNTTSKLFSNGQDFRELNAIFDYLYKNNYWSYKIYFRKCFDIYEYIKNQALFDNSNIHKELLSMWNNPLFGAYKMYTKFCAKVRRLKSLIAKTVS